MYDGPERRSAQISEELLEQIAERAADKALERVYTQIGKSVVNKVLWILGAAGLAALAWMKGAGKA